MNLDMASELARGWLQTEGIVTDTGRTFSLASLLQCVYEKACGEQIEVFRHRGLDPEILLAAYDWTLCTNGEVHGLVSGDQGFEPTGIVIKR